MLLHQAWPSRWRAYLAHRSAHQSKTLANRKNLSMPSDRLLKGIGTLLLLPPFVAREPSPLASFDRRPEASDQEAHSSLPDDEQSRRRVRSLVRPGKISQLLTGNAEQATANCANQKAPECWLSVCVKRERGG